MLLVVEAGGPKLDSSALMLKQGMADGQLDHILVIHSLVHGPFLLFILMFKYLLLTLFIYLFCYFCSLMHLYSKF